MYGVNNIRKSDLEAISVKDNTEIRETRKQKLVSQIDNNGKFYQEALKSLEGGNGIKRKELLSQIKDEDLYATLILYDIIDGTNLPCVSTTANDGDTKKRG